MAATKRVWKIELWVRPRANPTAPPVLEAILWVKAEPSGSQRQQLEAYWRGQHGGGIELRKIELSADSPDVPPEFQLASSPRL